MTREIVIFVLHKPRLSSAKKANADATPPPAAVRRILRKLGADIRDARRRRRLPMAVVADRAFTSRSTLQKVEAGNANVSIGIYAAVLQALGLLDGLGEIADIARQRWPDSGQRGAAEARPPQAHIKTDR